MHGLKKELDKAVREESMNPTETFQSKGKSVPGTP